eukprot:162369-Pelagomonas_calceolata.AAC.5
MVENGRIAGHEGCCVVKQCSDARLLQRLWHAVFHAWLRKAFPEEGLSQKLAGVYDGQVQGHSALQRAVTGKLDSYQQSRNNRVKCT